ncbi:MAG: signal peptidase II [Hyphomicrobiales bacterium]
MNMKLWGPFSRFGAVIAAAAFAIDQLHKWWMLYVYDIGAREAVTITRFFDLVMVWNTGISYGLFPQDSDLGRYVLLAIMLTAVTCLILWLAVCDGKLAAAALGLVIGGALGNVTDRMVYGKVADFFSFHAFGFHWYVFNLADVAIVAGVGVLLYDSFSNRRSAPSADGEDV